MPRLRRSPATCTGSTCLGSRRRKRTAKCIGWRCGSGIPDSRCGRAAFIRRRPADRNKLSFRMRAPAFLAIAALAAVPLAARQQAPTQFKSATEVVSVYTTVHDKSGRLVPDLRKEDFVVLDNGKEQPLTHFSNEATPFTAVVMLDQSGSMRPHRDSIVDAASAFVRQLTPVDKARIGRLGWRIQIEPPQFTSRQEDLLQVLRQVVGDAGASPVWLSVDQSITALYGLEGRRVILLMSDGQDAPAANQRQASFKDVVDRLRRANVMV